MAIIHPTIGGIQQSDGSLLSIGTLSDGQLPVRSGSQLIGTPVMDVVGGRLVATDTTHLRYAFVTSNQIRLYDGTNWRVRNLSAEITKLNTDTDVAGTALAVDKVYDVFALDTGSATAADVAFARWAIPSERFAGWAAGTYSKGDRVALNNASYASTYACALDADAAGNDGYTIRTVVPGSSLSTSGEYVKVTLKSCSSSTMVLAHTSIGECDAVGNIVNAFGTAQFKAVLFSGNAGCTVAQNSTLQSDALQFRIDKAKYYAITFDITTGGPRKKTGTALDGYYAIGASYNVQAHPAAASAGNNYGISDISVSAATYYVSVANSNTATPGTDVTKWASLGTIPANYDFAGLYLQDGIPVLGPSNATLDGRKYRWLGVIYTYNNSNTVNFKDENSYRYISNFYNQQAKTVETVNTNSTWTGYSTNTWREMNGGSGQTKGYFILAVGQSLRLSSSGEVYTQTNGAYHNTGINLDSTSAAPTRSQTVYVGGAIGQATVSASYETSASPGLHYITLIEKGDGSHSNNVLYGLGTEGNTRISS
jgi:hypothetical protein